MADPASSRKQHAADTLRAALKVVGGFLVLYAVRLVVRRMPRPEEVPTCVGTADDERERPKEPERPKTAFEPTDWEVGPVILIYAGVLVLLVVSCLVLIPAYPNSLPDVSRTVRIAPPGPRLQTDPEDDLQMFRAEEEKRLNSYYWIDKQKGIVHIPIKEAMQQLASKGVPGFPKVQQ
jgi:hypothetical protein